MQRNFEYFISFARNLERIKNNINELKQKKITENFISKNALLQDVTKEKNDNINTHNHDTFKNKNNSNNNKTANNSNNNIKNGNNHLPIKNTTTVKVLNNAFDKKANTPKAYNKEEIMSIVNKNENNELDSSDIFVLSLHKSLSSSKQSMPHQLNQEEYNHMIEENCENLEEILEMKKNLSFTYFNSFNISDNELFNAETKCYFDKRYLDYMEHIFFLQYEKTEKK